LVFQETVQLHFTGVEKYRKPQFTGQFAADHFEVHKVNNPKIYRQTSFYRTNG